MSELTHRLFVPLTDTTNSRKFLIEVLNERGYDAAIATPAQCSGLHFSVLNHNIIVCISEESATVMALSGDVDVSQLAVAVGVKILNSMQSHNYDWSF